MEHGTFKCLHFDITFFVENIVQLQKVQSSHYLSLQVSFNHLPFKLVESLSHYSVYFDNSDD